MTMITSWELIMAAHTSWHSSEAASGEKQSKEKNGASRFLSLPISEPPPHSGWYAYYGYKQYAMAQNIELTFLTTLIIFNNRTSLVTLNASLTKLNVGNIESKSIIAIKVKWINKKS